MLTLPDYLRRGLDIVFVGINPGWRSANEGHYFATPRNRFWPAFNAAELTPAPLGLETDSHALRYGIGFTDLVKRATRQMAELKTAEYREGAPLLKRKLMDCQPRVVCFNGVSGYRNYLRFAESTTGAVELGIQPRRIGRSKVFVVPSTSPANAAVSLEKIVACLRELKGLVATPEDGDG